ncbi:MAG: alpha/beta hydrolase [Bacteroidales bacterium]|nr:alpha/beta hydrolase [Bacteroidales bacterium]
MNTLVFKRAGLKILPCFFFLFSLSAGAWERQNLWPKNKMPDAQSHQIAEMTNVSRAEGFKPEKHRIPFLEWYEKPAPEVDKDICMILISGGSYKDCCDWKLIDKWHKELTALGIQCVNFVYRTPRPEGLPIYQTAWEDGQRAVRLVRSQAAKRGFDPEKIGVIAMSAGGHLGLLLAANSQTPAYARIDKTDDVPCHINWAILNAPAYLTSDAAQKGVSAPQEGYGPGIVLDTLFHFDEKTSPVCFHHGGADPYSPNGSTLAYRKLRKMGIPTELHLYPGKRHGAFGFERAVEFMTQLGYLGPLAPEEMLLDRFTSNEGRRDSLRMEVWPEGRTPDFQAQQCEPYLVWHFPDTLKTKAIQIIYSGGGYKQNDPDGFEVAPLRRVLNKMGMTVVTLKYRTPRPEGLPKHQTAWQDLQRTIRIVRSQAASYGLDAERIGIMGSSAGGHLTLMGTTSARHQSYLPVDKTIDKLSCKVAWGIGIYPAYVLSDGYDGHNAHKGNEEGDTIVSDFSFDLDTAPMIFIHGDNDPYSAMGSVKVWEKMRAMGIQSELHTLALRNHCFQRKAAPGTGSYNWMDRIIEYLQPFIAEK